MKYWVARSSRFTLPYFKVQCLVETAAGRLNVRYSGEPLGLYKARRADVTVSSASAHGMKTRFHKFRSRLIPALTIQDYTGPYLLCQAPAFHGWLTFFLCPRVGDCPSSHRNAISITLGRRLDRKSPRLDDGRKRGKDPSSAFRLRETSAGPPALFSTAGLEGGARPPSLMAGGPFRFVGRRAQLLVARTTTSVRTGPAAKWLRYW